VDESIAIEKRYYLALAFNPLSARKKKTFPPEVSCTHPTGPSKVDIELRGYLSDYEYGFGEGEEGLPAKTKESWLKKADGWDRKSWCRYYPSGIAKWTYYDESWRLHLMGKEGWGYVEKSNAFCSRFRGQTSELILNDPHDRIAKAQIACSCGYPIHGKNYWRRGVSKSSRSNF
jgi:hypothetical protein